MGSRFLFIFPLMIFHMPDCQTDLGLLMTTFQITNTLSESETNLSAKLTAVNGTPTLQDRIIMCGE